MELYTVEIAKNWKNMFDEKVLHLYGMLCI